MWLLNQVSHFALPIYNAAYVQEHTLTARLIIDIVCLPNFASMLFPLSILTCALKVRPESQSVAILIEDDARRF